MKLLLVDSILNSLTDIGNQFLASVPNLLKAIVVFIIGWLIAKIAAKAIRTFLEKIKIDDLGDKLNEIDIVAKTNIDLKLSKLFSIVVYYFLMLFVLVASADALGMPAVSQLVSDIFNFIPNLIVALIVLILGLLLSEAIRKLVLTTLTSLGIPSAKLIATFLFYFLFINVLVSALSQAKINTNFLSQNLTLIIGGIVLAFGLGYGLAAKSIMANFLGSFYSKNRFKVGDHITIAGIKGEIIDIDRSSITLSTESSKVIVPMSKTTSDTIEIHKD